MRDLVALNRRAQDDGSPRTRLILAILQSTAGGNQDWKSDADRRQGEEERNRLPFSRPLLGLLLPGVDWPSSLAGKFVEPDESTLDLNYIHTNARAERNSI
eukprot:TRINITY_DN74811_c0_g1_i1.p1 TRINITY_DN74811_c0_g1~~TRINITY_DN74811_c0_g1_i1.p1  ORF type:complete len:101 (-),score=3.47 TRINITY_DN74811_c0_g1_i1:28-330(-)